MSKLWFSVFAFVLLLSGATASAQTIDASWAIVCGPHALERTAADDLRAELRERRGVSIEVAGAANARPAIVVGTVDDVSLIADEHRRSPFNLGPSPESYHAVRRGDRVFVVGATPKGAMNGVYRLLDRGTLDVAGLDDAGTPAFTFRVGGHKMNQHPPADWSELDQARYYARHYVNVVWGEKQGPPMSHESRQAYGLGLMVELRFPPVGKDWIDDPSNASAVYRLSDGKDRRVVSPFDPQGRRAYAEGYRRLLEQNPDARILYAVFADYNAIPFEASIRASDGAPYGHTRPEGMKQILGIMKEVIGDRDVLPVAWLWHGFFGDDTAEAAFMTELAALGYGSLYNEAGNNDDWIIKRDNFNKTARLSGPDGRTAYAPGYVPLVSAGGACESINPVIGFPAPFVAANKIRILADLGVEHFAIWWAGYEGWVYQPNNAVVAELIWNSSAFDSKGDDDTLIRKIAERDFGPDLAPGVLEFWRLFDEAVVTDVPLYQPPDKLPPPHTDGLHIYDWYQRMGTFTEAIFGGGYQLPLTPDVLAGRRELKQERFWGVHPHMLANYAAVLKKLDVAVAKAEALRHEPAPPAVAKRLNDQYLWSDLYRRLLTTQHNFLRGLAVVHAHRGEPLDSADVRAALEPVVRDEIANCRALAALLPAFPANVNIRQNMEGTVSDRGSVASDVAALDEKEAAMRIWLERKPNLAADATAIASSREGAELDARFAIDGDGTTRWGSKYSDDQWLQIDLGAVKPVRDLTIHWNPAHAKHYEIQFATNLTAPQPWRTVFEATDGNGAVDAVTLPEPTPARYIRLRGHRRGTGWGYSITEFAAYGD